MTLLYLIIGILVVAAAVVVGLVTTGRRRTPPPVRGPETTATPDLAAPEAPAEAPLEEAAPVTTLERPEGTASRLVRLRQRLAGAQGGFGRGLLGLLSRERLDEDTWEAIEDTLLSADVGVGPTQQLVGNLRTRLRVDGKEAGDPRAPARGCQARRRAARARCSVMSCCSCSAPTWTAACRSPAPTESRGSSWWS